MKEFENYISILASLGTFVSAIVAVITLRALKRQTNSSYMPDIFLSFYTSNKIKVCGWNKVEKKEVSIAATLNDEEFEAHGLLYSIENVGFGVAKNLNIYVEFNYDKAIDMITSVLPSTHKLEIFSETIRISEIATNNCFVSIYCTRDLNNTNYDFILPRKDEKFDRSPSIQPSIIQLLSIYFLFKRELHLVKNDYLIFHEDFESFPKPILKIEYKDIGGIIHKRKFETSFSLSISNLDGDNDLSLNEILTIDFFPRFNLVY